MHWHFKETMAYSDDPEWADIVPLPQDDGGPNPLAAIAYTEEYSEAIPYLRAIMAKNELSPRALALTEDIIDMNPAHYTVWYALSRPMHHKPSSRYADIAPPGYTARRSCSRSKPTCVKKSSGSTRRPPRTRRTTRSGTTGTS